MLSELFQAIRDLHKVVPVNGDITLHNCGLDDAILATIRDKATIVIHAASTINLKKSPVTAALTVVAGSPDVAKLTLSRPHLITFVYVSFT